MSLTNFKVSIAKKLSIKRIKSWLSMLFMSETSNRGKTGLDLHWELRNICRDTGSKLNLVLLVLIILISTHRKSLAWEPESTFRLNKYKLEKKWQSLARKSFTQQSVSNQLNMQRWRKREHLYLDRTLRGTETLIYRTPLLLLLSTSAYQTMGEDRDPRQVVSEYRNKLNQYIPALTLVIQLQVIGIEMLLMYSHLPLLTALKN